MARPREFDEEQVVEEAMEVFWQRGYQATSVQDLVEATGLQRGSLYGAFGDKHGLFVAALDAYVELALRRFRQSVSEADDPVDGVREFVRRAGNDCTDPSLSARGCLVGNTCSELVAGDAVVRDRVQSFVSDMQRAMADALREGQRVGTFGNGRDPDAVAAFVQCSLQGLSLLAKSNPGPDIIRGVVDEVLRALESRTEQQERT